MMDIRYGLAVENAEYWQHAERKGFHGAILTAIG